MQLPIAIHKDENSVYGVIVPDIPGCHSWGDTIDDAIRNSKEAIRDHLEILLESGAPLVVQTSSIDALINQPDYADAIWAYAEVDLSDLDPKPERVNISLPRFVLRRIDAYTKANHETRSGFLSRVALRALAESAQPIQSP